MKKLSTILKFIWHHPLASKNRITAYKNFFSWQIGQKIFKNPVLVPLVEDSVMLITKGMAGATGNFYTGLLEFEDMAFILHVLRGRDIFGDVGANVGVYTILAAKNAGANVLSIEPIPSTFATLKQNVILNNVSDLVLLLPYGVGDVKSTLKFTNNMDTINHVITNKENTVLKDVTEIFVDQLDNFFADKEPVILKIDVEGFEWPALNGAKKLLSSSNLKGIIIELNGSGGRYGYSDNEIHSMLLSYSFRPYKYDPFRRHLTPVETYGKFNTIYVKDLDWVVSRVKESKKFAILNQKL